MKKMIKNMIGLLVIPAFTIGLTLFTPIVTSVSASVVCSDGSTAASGAECAKPVDVPTCLFGADCAFTNIVNAALFFIGAISVLMLIYGGIRYTTSGGSSKAVTDAKNTIMYAIIGIVVALLAFAIVNWVLGVLSATSA